MAKVQRVLDLGCGWSGFATALEKRFPEADVWGIDVGAPMVRWAPHRAVNLNLAVNFAQRLGEGSKVDSGSFDVVTRGNPQFNAPATVLAKAGQWADHRYNMKRRAPECRASDFPGVMRAAGFQVSIDPQRPGAFQEVTATKPA